MLSLEDALSTVTVKTFFCKPHSLISSISFMAMVGPEWGGGKAQKERILALRFHSTST
ncbi:hypothetical protein YC2023_019850 [Brassica napus]